MGTCDVCGQNKAVTEVRDYGYLQNGIAYLKQIGDEVLLGQIDGGPVEDTEELAPYELGEITLKLTEKEVAFLNECLDTIQENHESLCPGHLAWNHADVPLFESVEKKITALYEDNCVKYSLAPAMKSYIAIHGAIPDDDEKWVIFRDAFEAGLNHAQEG